MITISHNIAAVQKRLITLAGKVGDIQPALKDIGQSLENNIRERFDKETDPKGKQWQKLSDKTLLRKQKKGKSPMILHQDGDLRDQINSQVSDSTLIIGSPQKYAATHQLGRKIGSGKIPARPFLGISKQDKADILDDIKQHLNF